MLNPITLVAVGFLAFAAPAVAPGHATWETDTIPSALDWRVEPADAAGPAGTVGFLLGFHSENHSSMSGYDLPLAELQGLSAAQLAAAGQPVAFVLRRDAGDFRCKGVAGQGKGVGTCVFAANPDFVGALSARGVRGLGDYQQFQLALHDIGLAYVDELKREGYATPAAGDLVLAGTHGAGLRQLKAMDAVGYRFGDVASLVRVRDHGVSAAYIQALRSYGYTGLSAEALVRLRDHGVSANYIADLRQYGYARLNTEDLVRLRDHGVSAGFVAELRAMGYDGLAPEQLTRLRDHGVNAGFIRTANQGGQRLPPEDLIRMRDRGEQP